MFKGTPRSIGGSAGPIRGVGRYEDAGKKQQKRPITRTAPKPIPVPAAKPIQPPQTVRPTTSTVMHQHLMVPMSLTIDGNWEFLSHDGPRRGIGIGPGVVYHRAIRKPHEGPRRGVGPYTGTGTGSAGDDQKRCLDLVNKFRKDNGKPPLAFSKVLSDIAMPHTQAMLDRKVPLGHSGFKERSEKASFAMSTGENVGYESGYSDPVKTLVDGWISSPPHRRNLLGDFNQMGVAFAHRGDLWYGTQFFARV